MLKHLIINAGEWDSVYSYFLGVLKGNPESERTKQTASQFATVLFRICTRNRNRHSNLYGLL